MLKFLKSSNKEKELDRLRNELISIVEGKNHLLNELEKSQGINMTLKQQLIEADKTMTKYISENSVHLAQINSLKEANIALENEVEALEEKICDKNEKYDKLLLMFNRKNPNKKKSKK